MSYRTLEKMKARVDWAVNKGWPLERILALQDDYELYKSNMETEDRLIREGKWSEEDRILTRP